jgi:chemotaxis protein CheD
VNEVTIYIGDVFASQAATVVRTVLGSCIAVCLRDPRTGIGGMNHFMLPAHPDGGDEESPTRYGVHAMGLLIGKIQRLGGERGRLEAKIFGAGHVLQIADAPDSVPQRNMRFIQEFLRTEGIPIVAQDLGGRSARYVLFDTGTGRVRVKRLAGMMARVAAAEREHEREADREMEPGSSLTLFDDI